MKPHRIALVLVLALAIPFTAFGQTGVSEVYVSEEVVPVKVDLDLRQLPHIPAWQPGDPIEVVPEGFVSDFPMFPIEGWQDPIRQSGATEGTSFDGNLLFSFVAHPSGNSSPPDTVGSVGPDHYISAVNASRFAVWDKEGNNLVPETGMNTLFTVGVCTDGDGDPIVQYDHAADRWLMQQFELSGNTFCFAISQGPNPVTDGWFVYTFSAPSFPDYPQIGVWPDAYYVGTFESPFLGIYAFDRDAMLAGDPATFQRFTIPQLNGSAPRVTRILPNDAEGDTAPPPGEPATFMRTVHESQDSSDPTTRIEVWEFDVDWDTPANSTFTQAASLFPTAFALLPCSPGIRDCVPQPGTGNLIDALFNRALRDLKYRNFGTHESMVFNQVVDAGGGVAGKRWWEFRRTPTEGSGWTIFQEGTYSPDSEYRFMGSAAMNGNGDIALGYSVSSSSVFPEIRVTARRAGDAAGEMTMNELTLVPGEASYTSNQRWGDYTSMDVDPSNDNVFWYVNQRIDSNSQRSVWVGKFNLGGIFFDGFESGDTLSWSNTIP